MDILRVEIYLDESGEPLAVVTRPPFRLRLDPADLGEGVHTLTVVTHYQDGSSDRHNYVFDVTRKDNVFVGHVNQAPLHAPVEVDLVDPVELEERGRPSLLIYAVFPLLLFLGIAVVSWVIAVRAEKAVIDHPQVEAVARSVARAAPTASSTADGASIYAANCASCHGVNGEGVGGVFPALAGNEALADATATIEAVLHGRPGTSMPAFGDRLSDAEVAAVVSYIRNSWGNDYGAVDATSVAALR